MKHLETNLILKIGSILIAAALLLTLTANKASRESRLAEQRGEQQSMVPTDANASISEAQSNTTGSTTTPESGPANAALPANSGSPDSDDPDSSATVPTTVAGISTNGVENTAGRNPSSATGSATAACGYDPGVTVTLTPTPTPTPAATPARLPDGTRIAYITIDDGPSRNITPEILDILAQEGIKATFFVLPHDGVRDIYQRILDEGHEIGNHSYSHVYARLYNANDLDAFREDVITARSFIWENFGYLTTTFRFPGGMMGRNASIVDPRRAILEEMGYRYFDWNIDTGDANSRQADRSAAALTNNVLNNTNGRERIVVLMHDTSDKATTLEALPMIIAGLREQGYVFDVLRNYDDPNPSTPRPAAATSDEPAEETENTDEDAEETDEDAGIDDEDAEETDEDADIDDEDAEELDADATVTDTDGTDADKPDEYDEYTDSDEDDDETDE